MHGTLVTAEELARRVDDPAWVIVDCRHSLEDFTLGHRLYDAGHVPGAFFAEFERELAGAKTGRNGRHPLPAPEAFAAFLRELGVHPHSQIVAYDAGGDMFAARFWFLAKYIGHAAVAVLDGGFAAWTAAGKPVSAQAEPRTNDGTITPRVRKELTVDAQAILQSLDARDLLLLDARSRERFSGETEPIDPVAGHIPGAYNRSFRENFDERGFFKKPQALRQEFSALRLEPERLVHQCGSGVSAAVNMLAMEHAGISGTRLYPGSWSEWCADPSRPVETSLK